MSQQSTESILADRKECASFFGLIPVVLYYQPTRDGWARLWNESDAALQDKARILIEQVSMHSWHDDIVAQILTVAAVDGVKNTESPALVASLRKVRRMTNGRFMDRQPQLLVRQWRSCVNQLIRRYDCEAALHFMADFFRLSLELPLRLVHEQHVAMCQPCQDKALSFYAQLHGAVEAGRPVNLSSLSSQLPGMPFDFN